MIKPIPNTLAADKIFATVYKSTNVARKATANTSKNGTVYAPYLAIVSWNDKSCIVNLPAPNVAITNIASIPTICRNDLKNSYTNSDLLHPFRYKSRQLKE